MSPLNVALTLFAAISRGSFSVAQKDMRDRLDIHPATCCVVFSITALLLTLATNVFAPSLIGGISFHGLDKAWPDATIVSLSFALANVAVFYAQSLFKKLTASATQIMLACTLPIGTWLAHWVLGTPLSPHLLVGVTMLIGAIGLGLYEKGAARSPVRGLALILIAAGLFSLFQVKSAQLSEHISGGTYAILAYGVTALVVGVARFTQIRGDLGILRKQPKTTILTGLSTGSTSFLYLEWSYHVYQGVPKDIQGTIVILLNTHVVISVALGAWLLKERTNLRLKLLAVLIAIPAVLLIKGVVRW
ncbi:MAG: hypothetical protein JWN01_662 [Patescibacteria group bacterium]|nr:hypothetical protein [Patescibacteria group bacterium]